MLGADPDPPELRALRFVQRPRDLHIQELGVRDDRLQRGAQLVRHGGQERALRPVLRFHLSAGLRGLLGGLQRCVRRVHRGEITCKLGEALE